MLLLPTSHVSRRIELISNIFIFISCSVGPDLIETLHRGIRLEHMIVDLGDQCLMSDISSMRKTLNVSPSYSLLWESFVPTKRKKTGGKMPGSLWFPKVSEVNSLQICFIVFPGKTVVMLQGSCWKHCLTGPTGFPFPK